MRILHLKVPLLLALVDILSRASVLPLEVLVVEGFSLRTSTSTRISVPVLGTNLHLHLNLNPYEYENTRKKRNEYSYVLNAKRRKNDKAGDDSISWYDEIDEDATPDDIFWEEMERQRAMSAPAAPSNMPDDPFQAMGSGSGSGSASGMGMSAANSGNTIGGSRNANINTAPPTSMINGNPSSGLGGGGGIVPPGMEERATEKILANYAAFMVDDNWLDDDYAAFMGMDEDMDIDAQDADLDRQISEWGKEGDGDNDDDEFRKELMYGQSEPWDEWNPDGVIVSNDDDDVDESALMIQREKAKSEMAKEFLVENRAFSDGDGSEMSIENEQSAAEEEARYVEQLSKIQLQCRSLEKARDNPTAKKFFSRAPNEIEGYDRLWVSAIDNACVANLAGNLRNFGIEFACNFGDWGNGCDSDALQSIEDIASYKARKVYEITGLPTVAARTSFEVEPAKVQDRSTPMNRSFQNTRITSGYRFNDVGDHVDYVVEALKPYSEPTRITRFRSCFCFYDGEIEIYDYGELDCDIYFSNSMRTYIPMSGGIDNLGKTLKLTFGLEFQGWLTRKVRESMNGSDTKVSMKLRDRILKEGKVLPNSIVDVSSFMDSMVDVNLMDDCAKELSGRFEHLKPTKILTIATTGLVIAIPMAKYLQVPVVYARKERNVVMSDTFKAAYSSKTVGKNRELLVSKNHIDTDDRILIVDDFLSSAASQEALLRIISDSGAQAIGVGVLLEKSYDAGRQALSGFNVPVESVAKIASVTDGIITMEEEEGYSSTS